MARTFQAAIFDLDETLIDKSATLLAVAEIQYSRFSLGAFGITIQEWEERYVGLNLLRIEKSAVFGRLGERFSFGRDLQAVLLNDFDKILGAHVKPYAGAIETIQACKADGLKVGIITNGRDSFQRSKIQGMGISDDVDVIITSGGVGIKKPDRRIFEICLDSLQVNPREAAYVGDNFEADMEPAIKLGMCAIWKSDSTSPQVSLSSNDFFEIRDFLLN